MTAGVDVASDPKPPKRDCPAGAAGAGEPKMLPPVVAAPNVAA